MLRYFICSLLKVEQTRASVFLLVWRLIVDIMRCAIIVAVFEAIVKPAAKLSAVSMIIEQWKLMVSLSFTLTLSSETML